MPAKGTKPSIQLQSFADMLDFPVMPEEPKPQEGRSGTILLELSRLEFFPDHEQYFPLYTGPRLKNMMSSILRFGVQTPIIVWKTEDGRHIIVSGHNRANASVLAGLTVIPADIRTDLTEKSAEDLFFELNFHQRSLADMVFSQRVLCVAAHYNMAKRQGQRTDLVSLNGESDELAVTSPDSQEKLHTDAKIAEEYELTRDKVSKYCRYATLYRPLLLAMDKPKVLGLMAAYEISFIEDQTLQEQIYLAITEQKVSISKGKAQKLRREYEHGTLDTELIQTILGGNPPSKASAKKLNLSIELTPAYTDFFAEGTTQKQIKETIYKALELYFQTLANSSVK